MAKVESEYGDRLAALAGMRDLGITELRMYEIGSDEPHRLLMGILFAHSIGTLDSIRVLLEHGYGSRALTMVRALFELEVDIALLRGGDEDLMLRYRNYERLELSQRGARSMYAVDGESEVVRAGIRARFSDLVDGLQEAGHTVREGFDRVGLEEACREFGKLVLGDPYPSGWRNHFSRRELIDLVASAQAKVVDGFWEGSEAYGSAMKAYEGDFHFGYGLGSAVAHSSPRSVAEGMLVDEDGALSGFTIGGRLAAVPESAGMAALHAYRIRCLVEGPLGLASDRGPWQVLLRPFESHSPGKDFG